jgi:hypothetical protein
MERCGSSGWRAGRHADTAGSGVTRQALSKRLRVLAGGRPGARQLAGRQSLGRLEPRRLDQAPAIAGPSVPPVGLGRLRMFVEE